MPACDRSLPMVNNAIPCSSDQVGPATSRGSPAGRSFAPWHRTMASSRSLKARKPAVSSSGLSLLSSLGAEHHLVVVGVGDSPVHIGPSHAEHLLDQIVRFGSCVVQGLVELDETLGGHGGQQLCLVREVAVRSGGAHARASGDLSQREAFRPLLLHQPQRRLRQGPLQITVVIGVALLF